jgi:2-hydroxymuconate-semialdehyde hydrolase
MLVAALIATAVALGTLYVVGIAMTARVEAIDVATLRPLPGARFVTTKSGRTHYIDVGAGPPILLLHGSGGSLAAWQEGTIERLSRTHRVVAFDFFGSGFSERSSSFAYGYTLWVDQAVELLQALDIDHVTVIGHSVGGALACVLAADHPLRVDHVVTIGTGMTIEPQQVLLLVPGLGEVILANTAAFTDTKAERYRAALEAAYAVKGTRAALLSYARRQATIDGIRLLWGTFEDVRAPVLHLSGTRDAHIPHDVARALAERTQGRFVPVEGAGHDVHIEAPERLAAEVERFLAETPTRHSLPPPG